MKTPLFATFLLSIILFALPSFSYAEDAEELYETALEFLENDDKKSAIIELKNTLKQFPSHLPARILLGEILIDESSVAEAKKHLEMAISLDGDLNLIMPLLGECWLYLENSEEILSFDYQNTLVESIKIQWQVIRGKALLNSLKFEQAFTEFQAIYQQLPNNEDALVGMAYSQLFLKKNALASEYASIAIEKFPSSSNVFKLRGDILSLEGNLDDALVAYNTAISFDENNLSARQKRLTIYLSKEMVELADEEVEHILAVSPYDPKGLLYKAIFLAKQKKNTQARIALETLSFKLSNLDEKYIRQNSNLLLIKGMALYLQDRIDESLPYLTAYNQSYPHQASVYHILTEVYFRRKQYAQILKMYKNISQLEPGSETYIGLFVKSAWLTGKFEVAQNKLTQWIEGSPENTLILNQFLVGTLYFSNDAATAKSVLLNAKNNMQNINSLLFLGHIQLEQGEFQQAKLTASTVLEHYPESVSALNYACLVEKRLENIVKAIEYCSRAHSIDERYPNAAINLGLLYLKQQEFTLAENMFKKVLDGDPRQLSAFRGLIQIAEANKNWSIAIRYTESLASFKPRKVEHKIQLSRYYLFNQEPDKALVELEKAAKLSFMNPQIIALKSEAYLQLKNEVMATKQLSLLFELSITNLQELKLIAKKQLKLSNKSYFEKTLKQINLLDEGGNESKLLNSYLFHHQGKASDCISTLESIEVKPTSIESQVLLARCQIQNKNPKAAINIFKTLHQESKDERWAKRAFQLEIRIDKPKAAKYLSSLEQQSNSPLLTKLLADSLIFENQERAITLYLKVAEQHPTFDIASINNNLANLFIDRDLVKARDFAQIAYDATPNNAQIADTLGWILTLNNQAPKGLVYLRQAYSRNSIDNQIKFHLVYTLYSMKKVKEADRHRKTLNLSKLTQSQQNQLAKISAIKNS